MAFAAQPRHRFLLSHLQVWAVASLGAPKKRARNLDILKLILQINHDDSIAIGIRALVVVTNVNDNVFFALINFFMTRHFGERPWSPKRYLGRLLKRCFERSSHDKNWLGLPTYSVKRFSRLSTLGLRNFFLRPIQGIIGIPA
ncbi:MAG: hypothetical protein CMH54_01070 [Myxococcales bacterium]|nr:hypothetical protein [Myxococcales bacterium]